jgi:uncharacterized MAPEG superfamily protein
MPDPATEKLTEAAADAGAEKAGCKICWTKWAMTGYNVVGVLVTLIMAYLLMTEQLNLAGGLTEGDISADFGQVIKYVFRYQSLNAAWLLFCVLYICYQRHRSGAKNPMEPHGQEVERARNIMQNSMEQYLIFIVSQLVLVSYLRPHCVLGTVPFLNITYIIGRISFWLGYPEKRCLGFAWTFVPLALTVLYNTFKFFEFIINY